MEARSKVKVVDRTIQLNNHLYTDTSQFQQCKNTVTRYKNYIRLDLQEELKLNLLNDLRKFNPYSSLVSNLTLALKACTIPITNPTGQNSNDVAQLTTLVHHIYYSYH